MSQIEAEISKEEAIKIIDTDLKEYYEINNQIKELTDKQKSMKSEISSILKKFFIDTTNDECLYKNDNYYARLTKGSRSTLKKELVEKLLKVEVTNECYTTTISDTLKVDTIDKYKEKKPSVTTKQVVMEKTNEEPIKVQTEYKSIDTINNSNNIDFNIEL